MRTSTGIFLIVAIAFGYWGSYDFGYRRGYTQPFKTAEPTHLFLTCGEDKLSNTGRGWAGSSTTIVYDREDFLMPGFKDTPWRGVTFHMVPGITRSIQVEVRQGECEEVEG